MTKHNWLDRFFFGEEVLIKWDKEREGRREQRLQENGYLTPAEREKQRLVSEERDIKNELLKIGDEYTYKLEELPEILKKAVINQCKGLEGEKLKKHLKDNIECNLFSKYHKFLEMNYMSEFGGVSYVENTKGEWALRPYLKRIWA